MVIVALVAACSQRPPQGVERGDCYGNGTCDDGLICLSELCVRPPPADCGKVADKLSYLMLDNWTPRDKRDAFLAETRAGCDAAKLSKDDARCIFDADNREVSPDRRKSVKSWS